MKPEKYKVSIARAGEQKVDRSLLHAHGSWEYDIEWGFQTTDVPLASKP